MEPQAGGGELLSVGEGERDGECGGDSGDVVGPEDGFGLGQVAGLEIGSAGGGLDSDSADLYVEQVGLGCDNDVGSVDGQLFVDAVADGGGEGEHGGDGGCSEQDG